MLIAHNFYYILYTKYINYDKSNCSSKLWYFRFLTRWTADEFWLTVFSPGLSVCSVAHHLLVDLHCSSKQEVTRLFEASYPLHKSRSLCKSFNDATCSFQTQTVCMSLTIQTLVSLTFIKEWETQVCGYHGDPAEALPAALAFILTFFYS